tara:strand:+ start:4224 stop:4613 length:390 start_codon:yes stop_codon:yes gene_type:complete
MTTAKTKEKTAHGGAEVVERALADLMARDVTELLDSGEEEQARAVMKIAGMSKTNMDKTIKEHDQMTEQNDMKEAVDLVEELLDMTSLDEMIKDFKSSEKDDDFLGYCISLRGQAKDFLKKHGKKGETA